MFERKGALIATIFLSSALSSGCYATDEHLSWEVSPTVVEQCRLKLSATSRNTSSTAGASETSTSFNPSDARGYHRRGLARFDAGDLDGALADYSAAIELDGRDLEARLDRADVLATKRDFDCALADFDEAVRIAPLTAEPYVMRGAMRADRGDPDAALADFSKAVQVDPRSADAHFMRGLTRVDKEDFDGAIADFSDSIELLPKDADAYLARGNAHRAKGNLEAALEDYRQALQVAPPDWSGRAVAEKSLARVSAQGPAPSIVSIQGTGTRTP